MAPLFFGWLSVINGLVYTIYTAASGRLERDLTPILADRLRYP